MKKTLIAMLIALSMLLCGCSAPQNEPVAAPVVEAFQQPSATEVIHTEAKEMDYSPTAITTIASAMLEYKPYGNWEGETSVAHTADHQALATMASWLKDAVTLEYFPQCFESKYEGDRLTLTLADGAVLKALLAVDSCTILRGGNVFYNFEPAPYRGTGDHPQNKILYALFGVERE